MKIGIICLANGPYSIFINNLIESCEKNFLPTHKKEYFIITDNSFEYSIQENVHTILKKRNGWPLDCLLRPHYSFELKKELEHLDYVYFFNANMSIYDEIGEEILPDNEYRLVGVEHACYLHRNNYIFTYDRNPRSKAYIPFGEGLIYYQACLWGGITKDFIELSETIKEWTDIDIKNNIEPIWLDESYLNKYFLLNSPKTLSSLYAWPTNMDTYEKPKILQLQKKDYIKENNFKFL
jgi:hypothetical protein